MTLEELKKIEVPKTNEKKISENAKNRNAILLQISNGILLFIYAVFFAIAFVFLGFTFLGRVLKLSIPTAIQISPVFLFLGVFFAWFLSRKTCRKITKHFLKNKIPDDVFETYMNQ